MRVNDQTGRWILQLIVVIGGEVDDSKYSYTSFYGLTAVIAGVAIPSELMKLYLVWSFLNELILKASEIPHILILANSSNTFKCSYTNVPCELIIRLRFSCAISFSLIGSANTLHRTSARST